MLTVTKAMYEVSATNLDAASSHMLFIPHIFVVNSFSDEIVLVSGLYVR